MLLGVSRATSKNLKLFGYLIAILLWITVALAAVTKIYVMSSDKCRPRSKMGYHRMHKEETKGKRRMPKEGMRKERQQ